MRVVSVEWSGRLSLNGSVPKRARRHYHMTLFQDEWLAMQASISESTERVGHIGLHDK